MLTDARPSFTCTRSASSVPSTMRNRPTVLCGLAHAPAGPRRATSGSRSSSIVPSTLRSGRAPFGSVAVERDVDGDRAVLDRRVDADDAALRRRRCACRRVAFWPIRTSLAWVSGIRITAFSLLGLAPRARGWCPAPPAGPTSTGTSCSTPSMPARTFSASTCCAAQPGQRARLLDVAPAAPRAAPRSPRRRSRAASARSSRGCSSSSAATLRELERDVGDRARSCASCVVGVGPQPRLPVLGCDARRGRLLVEQLALEPHLELGAAAPRRRAACDSASCGLGSSSGLLSSRITESAFTLGARAAARSARRAPSVVAGIQRMSSGTSVPRPRTCAHHRAALHGVDHDRRALDGRGRRLEPRQAEGRTGRSPPRRRRSRSAAASSSSRADPAVQCPRQDPESRPVPPEWPRQMLVTSTTWSHGPGRTAGPRVRFRHAAVPQANRAGRGFRRDLGAAGTLPSSPSVTSQRAGRLRMLAPRCSSRGRSS